MYIKEAVMTRFLLSVALSFWTTVMSRSLRLMVVIRVIINEVNGVVGTVKELQFDPHDPYS